MFRYFRDPDNFAFKVDQASPCSVCGRVGLWFDAEGFYGANEIECICDDCLAQGRLKELEMETNEASEGTEEEKDIIRFRTPALPIWQDRMWPFVNGQYCVFERWRRSLISRAKKNSRRRSPTPTKQAPIWNGYGTSSRMNE